MLQRVGLWSLWLAFVIYSFGFSPPDQPETLELIQRLIAGPWQGINPLIVALFNIMGIWPLAYACVLFADGRGQKIPAWPFVIGSFALGAFALIPYLALRQPNPGFVGEIGKGLKFWESRGLAIGLLMGGLGLLIYGLLEGNWADFVVQWQTSRFIHVMSLDFCVLTLLFPVIVGDDQQRRGFGTGPQAWIAWIPFIGPLLYLCARPALRLQNQPYQEIQNPTPESV